MWKFDDLRPDVRGRLKRVFPRADPAGLSIRLSATPQVSAEVLWFCSRYRMLISDEDLSRLERLADTHESNQASIMDALDSNYERPVLAMAKPARPYQDQAAELAARTGGTLVGDELGLGKTVTGIALLARQGRLPATVVVQPNLLRQWERRINEFLPTATVHLIKSSVKSESPRRRAARLAADIVLISYGRLDAWRELLRSRTLIFDEIHELRHKGTAKYSAAFEIRDHADVCMGLSATPIWNYGGEFFNVFGIVRPGALGTREEFMQEWCTSGGDKPRLRDPESFGAWVRSEGLMIRRSRRDVGRELPAIVRTIINLNIDNAESADFEACAWRALYGDRHDRFRARGEFDARLRQWTGVAKAPAVADFVDSMIAEHGEPVVLTGWHRSVYDIWTRRLERWSPVLYTGTESSAAKDKSFEALRTGASKVMLMSIRSGQGLDGLQGTCHRIVHGELDWSPWAHRQATGRIHRDGQQASVMEYWAVADQGCDPVIIDTLGVKSWQSDGVIDPLGHRQKEVRVDPDALRDLARSYLKRRGKNPDVAPEVSL